MSIFNKLKDYVEPVKRNSFDGSFQNNLTMQFGALYPVLCKEVLPGDAFKIKPTFAIKSFPMMFPVQTRMRAYLHFFYVRNRNLWKDWPDFIGKTKDGLQLPYVAPLNSEQYNKMFATGSLGDYLGIPSHSYGAYGAAVEANVPSPSGVTGYTGWSPTDFKANTLTYVQAGDWPHYTGPTIADFVSSLSGSYGRIPKFSTFTYQATAASPSGRLFSSDADNGDYYAFIGQTLFPVGSANPIKSLKAGAVITVKFLNGLKVSSLYRDRLAIVLHDGDGTANGMSGTYVLPSDFSGETDTLSFVLPTGDYESISSVTLICGLMLSVFSLDDMSQNNLYTPFGQTALDDTASGVFTSWYNATSIVKSVKGATSLYFKNGLNNVVSPYAFCFAGNGYTTVTVSQVDDVSTDVTYATSPYRVAGTEASDDQIKVSALPFRAYESIYNAFYRDTTNNPYFLNGQPEYNKYIPTDDGGEDNNLYELRFRNWEADFLTTAKQTPQQGVAPLVGISSTGQMTFQDESGRTYQAQAEFSEDGNTITSFKVQSPDMPQGNLRALVDMASSGISINDLRNVNALQRWLEANIRRGLRYREQIKTHFNVDVEYKTLDMPEFLGGYAEDIFINQVTQTTPATEATETPLGWFAGVGNLVKTANRTISRYFDEHGLIIGILSVAPVPNYSQLLPKIFLKRDTLDFYFPEFGHIGMQPIFYDEVCPIQAYSQSPDAIKETFGYQRAWYDYLANVDEVHGLFRTELRNFVFNRVFDIKPELSPSFLTVDPSQLNDVFAVTEITDKLLGQVYFDIKMKRPIPVYGIPALDSHNLP